MFCSLPLMAFETCALEQRSAAATSVMVKISSWSVIDVSEDEKI